MSEIETPAAEPEAKIGTPEAAPPADSSKTFTQADVDRIVGQRLARDREQYADYDQLKEAAAELAKIREGEKTELQKVQERIAEAESARESAQTELAAVKRTQYGMDKGLPRDLAELLTAGDDESLDAQIEKLLPHVAPKAPEPKVTNGGLRSGVTGSGPSSADPKERAALAIRELFDR